MGTLRGKNIWSSSMEKYRKKIGNRNTRPVVAKGSDDSVFQTSLSPQKRLNKSMPNFDNYYCLVTVLPREFLVLAPRISRDVLFNQLNRNAESSIKTCVATFRWRTETRFQGSPQPFIYLCHSSARFSEISG